MRLGIDCTFIDTRYVGGLNSYIFGLIEGFLKYVEDYFQIVIYVTEDNQKGFEKYAELKFVTIRVIETRGIDRFIKRTLLRILIIVGWPQLFRICSDSAFAFEARQMEREIDLLYTPYLLSYFSFQVPTMSSMHDIQHVHFPKFFSRYERMKRKIKFGLTARHSTYLQASSNYIKNDFVNYFDGLNSSKIVVIPEGVNVELFSQKRNVENLIRKHNLPDKFFFYPAQLWKHKNHITLLRAMVWLRSKGIKIWLVLTGARMSGSESIFDFINLNSLEDQVVYLGKVPFEELATLYKATVATVVPSLHESSSLPILEAAASGAPVIAARIPAIEEMATRLKIYLFDATDHIKLAELLEDTLKNRLDLEEQIDFNLDQIRYYTWDNAAELYLNVFMGHFNLGYARKIKK